MIPENLRGKVDTLYQEVWSLARDIVQARTLIANSSDDEDAAVILGARQLGFEGEALALVEVRVQAQTRNRLKIWKRRPSPKKRSR